MRMSGCVWLASYDTMANNEAFNEDHDYENLEDTAMPRVAWVLQAGGPEDAETWQAELAGMQEYIQKEEIEAWEPADLVGINWEWEPSPFNNEHSIAFYLVDGNLKPEDRQSCFAMLILKKTAIGVEGVTIPTPQDDQHKA